MFIFSTPERVILNLIGSPYIKEGDEITLNQFHYFINYLDKLFGCFYVATYFDVSKPLDPYVCNVPKFFSEDDLADFVIGKYKEIANWNNETKTLTVARKISINKDYLNGCYNHNNESVRHVFENYSDYFIESEIHHNKKQNDFLLWSIEKYTYNSKTS